MKIGFKEIALTKGKVAIVDEGDYERLNQHKWHALPAKRAFYAVRNVPCKGSKRRYSYVYMHKEIVQPPEGMMVDHKDGDGLNNRRENLRLATGAQNSQNRSPYLKKSSKFKGVTWKKNIRKWQARITVDGKLMSLGYYNHEETAAIAYNNAANDMFGEFAKTSEVPNMKIAFGCITNDAFRFNTVLKKSDLPGKLNFFFNPESATKGLNKLLDIIEGEGADVAILLHHDMYIRNGWLEKVKEQIAKLPDDWVCAGIVGKDMEGRICGKLHDMRIVDHVNTSEIHEFPQPAASFDECCIIINMKSGFRFDESLDGFDLYGTLCVLQAWEMGGTAWIIDAWAEHYCTRSLSWFPDEDFKKRYKMLYDRFNESFGQPDSTVFVSKPEFETSANI